MLGEEKWTQFKAGTRMHVPYMLSWETQTYMSRMPVCSCIHHPSTGRVSGSSGWDAHTLLSVTIMLLPPFPGNSPLQLSVGVFSLIVTSFCGNVRKKWCTVTQNVVLTHAHALRDNKNKLWWFEGCWARIFCSLLVSLKRRKKAERAWWKKRGRLSADWRPLGERETD